LKGGDKYFFAALFAPHPRHGVIAGHSRPKGGVASLAYDPAIHEVKQRMQSLRMEFLERRHGLPDQVRQ
jgi:hypothetical protein